MIEEVALVSCQLYFRTAATQFTCPVHPEANGEGGQNDNQHPRWSLEPLIAGAPLAAAGVLAALVSGLALTGLTPRPKDLHRE